MAVVIEFGSQGSDTGTTPTIVGLDFNAEASDRIIAVTLAMEADTTITGVTIGGVTADLLVSAIADTLPDKVSEIWQAEVPTGTSGDVVVTIASGTQEVSAATFSITGADPTPTDTDEATGSDVSISITALTIPTDGAGLASVANGNASGTWTWTGASEVHDTDVGSFLHSSAIVTTAGTNTITADGPTNAQALVGVAWGPASGGAATSRPIFSSPPRFIRRRAA